MSESTTGQFGLRCHSCSHGIGFADGEMRLVAMFRPSFFGEIPKQEGEVRKVCRRCRWVNVFMAAAAALGWRDIETKQATG